MELLTKLYETKYGCKPAKKEVIEPAPSGAQKNLMSRPPAEKDDSDDYDDDFDDIGGGDKSADKKAAKPGQKASDWDLEDDGDWGELDSNNGKRKEESKDEDKKRQLMFGGAKDDFTDLDDLPDIGSNFPGGKNEDKFNQVMSSSKEGGGLLASIGLKKEDVKDNDSVG